MNKVELNSKLIAAVNKNDVAQAQELLYMGADAGAYTGSTLWQTGQGAYRTVLMTAAQFESPAMLKLLLSFKPQTLDHCDREGMTALHFAVIHERWHAIDLLLQAGANINARGGYGMEPPPLHTAIYCDQKGNDLRRTKYLLEHGASALVSNASGRSAYSIANEKTRDVLVHHVSRMAELKAKKIEEIATNSTKKIKITKIKPKKPGP